MTLSFELSAIDIVLTTAVIILFILYITKSPTKSIAKEKPSPFEKALRKDKVATVRRHEQMENTDAWKCSHSFGYLTKLPKATSIPNECLACPRIVECSSRS